MFFANFASQVTLLVRGASLADSMSHYLIQQLATKGNIEVCTRCRIVRVEGEHSLESIVIEHRDTGALVTEPASAVFVFIGADAQTDWLPAPMIRDENGYVCTGRDVMDLVAGRQGMWPLERDPFLLETSVPGDFRGRRRAAWFDQARRVRGRRGQHGHRVRPPVLGVAGGAPGPRSPAGELAMSARRSHALHGHLPDRADAVHRVGRPRPRRAAPRARLHDRPGRRRHLHPRQLFGAVPADRRRARHAARPVPDARRRPRAGDRHVQPLQHAHRRATRAQRPPPPAPPC